MIVFYTISGVLIFYLIFPFLTVIASFLIKNKKNKAKTVKEWDFANIITAYKNVDIARGLVYSLINQNYKNFHIYLVADAADIAGWDIQHGKLTVLKPESNLNLKVKSIIYATEHFERPHEYTVIWDADNIAHPDFLIEINKLANAECLAIQGQRTAKNLDTDIAAADALGEFYKNYIERQIPPQLGSSAVISGSGMAIETRLYNRYLFGEEITKGKTRWKKMMQEDKILQNHIINEGEYIVYAPSALCYDEKVTTANAVETQRSRWLYSYFQNLPHSTRFLLRGVWHLEWLPFFFGLITAAPPMFILLVLSSICFFLSIWIDVRLAAALGLSIIIFSFNILWVLKLSGAPLRVLRAVTTTPLFMVKQFSALFKMANPNKNFKHSEHHVNVSIDDLIQKQ
jgi:cellulose synthase/poly-beta-1,6-N-acetylglucosamine synthase-like glycosyltransferase